jgi:MFS family permease
MSSLGVSLLNDDATDSQPQHRNFSTRPEQRSDDQAEVTWSDYWRLLTDRQLLPIYALSLCVLATKQLDDNLSLLLSQGACIEEGVTAELCRHQDQLSASTEWHDASLRIAQRAAKLASYGQTGNQLCQMLTMLFLGAASDRIGRKPVLQVVLFGCFLDYALIATVKHLDALVALHAVTGVLCGPMFQAYAVMIATDLTTAQDRMLTMAMMHGLMFAAGAGAPICIGGFVKLLTTSSRGYLEALRFTFGFGSVIILCALLYVRLRFVESLQVAKSERERDHGHDGTQCMRFTSAVLRKGNPRSMWQLLAETREYTIIPTLVTAIFAINHFASGASVRALEKNPEQTLTVFRIDPSSVGLVVSYHHLRSEQVLVPLYTEHMFGWEAFEMGIFKSVGGILNIFASLVLLPALVICFGERRAAITMMCFGLSGFVLMGFSGVAAVATVPGDGSTADTLPADAGAGRWAREACMVVGFPLHNMVRYPRLPASAEQL